jgi:hypothetical protein
MHPANVPQSMIRLNSTNTIERQSAMSLLIASSRRKLSLGRYVAGLGEFSPRVRLSFSLKAAKRLVRGSPGSELGRSEDEGRTEPGSGPSVSRARLGILSPDD